MTQDDIQELEDNINFKDSSKNTLNPSQIAKILKHLKDDDNDKFDETIQKIDHEILGDVMLELPSSYIKYFLAHLPSQNLVDAISELESDDQTDLIQEFEEIDGEKSKIIFDALQKDDQDDINRLKNYDEDVAGAYMQTEVFKVTINQTPKDAIAILRDAKAQNELENIHNLYITDDEDKLLYLISLEYLLLFEYNLSFEQILQDEANSKSNLDEFIPVTAKDDDDIDDVVKQFEEYDFSVMPIVDSHNRIIGRITSDDIHDIIEERATEQIYNLAGVDDEAEESEENYFVVGRTRGFWLLLNLFTAIMASLVIGIFEETLSQYVALAILMPIVASMGGNAGTQTLTVVVRQLALGDIQMSDAYKTVKKEMIISLGNGLIFALIMGVIAYLWFDIKLLGIVIGLSMIINLFFAGFFGATIPLLLKRFDIDPAVGSSVLLTTITDIVGFFAFLGLAKLIL